MNRRTFLASAAGATAALGLAPNVLADDVPRLRLSACDWSMGMRFQTAAVKLARQIGLDGVEAACGNPADTLQIATPAIQDQYKALMKETGIVVSSTAMTLGNQCPLATDKRAAAWFDQTIEATKALGATNILMAFFGKGNLRQGDELKKTETDNIVARLKEAAPKAEKLGVVLGLENTLSAKHNMLIMDRVGSPALKVYYDCRNSWGNGFDVPDEIRQLKDRICQFHFKDGKDYLGEGMVKWDQVRDAMNAIDYKGWIVLETSCPSKDRVADFKRNADFVRKLFGMKA